MASWNENVFDGCNPYFDDPCPYCEGPHFWQDCEYAPGREMCAPSQSYDESICNICGGQGGHWGDCPNYFASPPPSCSNENASCAFELDRDNDMANEGQSAGYEGIMAMLQTYLDREAKMEEERKLVQQTILENGDAMKRTNDPFEDANSSIVMEVSTPQNEMIEEEISSLQDESENSYDHDESCEIEEMVQLEEEEEEEHNLEEEISNSQKEEVEEILKSIMGRNEQYGQVLTKLWEEVQQGDDETIQKVYVTMDGFLQELDDSHNEENLDKMKILSQDWLMNQAQQLEAYGNHREGISWMMEEFLKIHVEQSQEVKLLEITIQKLEAELNARIEACDAQYQRAMDCSFELVSNEEEVKIDFHELMVNCQPTNPKIVNDAKIEEMILELHKKVHEMVFENSSSFLGEDVKNEANLKFERLRPHSNHFSTLCLVDDMEVELTEPMENFGDEDQSVFILKFAMPRRQNGMPHLRAKKCKMRHPRVGLFAFLPPPHEHHRNLDSKLGRKFISSKWKEKW